MMLMLKGLVKDRRIMEEKKVLTIQQEVMRQKKMKRKISKNRSKALSKIGPKFYVC
jgi:hypothetical protein